MIIRSLIKEIYAEYRTWFVGGRLVTVSQYRLGDKVAYSSIVDDDVLTYAEKMESIWHPQQAFVLDVCRTEAGLRIMEINTINSAGFYAADVFKIFKAVENL